MNTPNEDSNKVVIQKSITNKQAELEKEYINELKRKIEYLKSNSNNKCFDLTDINLALKDGYEKGIKEGKTQAIYEFKEKLKKKFCSDLGANEPCWNCNQIDKTAQEITG